SPSAVAGVRGTEFNVAVDEEESTKLGCFEGLVEVSAQGETVKVPAGFGTSVKKGEKPVKPYKLLEKVKPKPIIKEDDTEN
ncbi:MAG TPA: iron dicitrate transport regulator FecR, partial [Leptospiraceae bacterium]|nr:iron dicitrate transport regulator FecR [Leptospiraceae bacterium]